MLDAGAGLSAFGAILLGGAAIPSGLLAGARAAGAKVITTYGMSETCGGCVYNHVPLDGVQLRTAPDGRIQINGPVLFSGYRNRPDLTERLSKKTAGSPPRTWAVSAPTAACRCGPRRRHDQHGGQNLPPRNRRHPRSLPYRPRSRRLRRTGFPVGRASHCGSRPRGPRQSPAPGGVAGRRPAASPPMPHPAPCYRPRDAPASLRQARSRRPPGARKGSRQLTVVVRSSTQDRRRPTAHPLRGEGEPTVPQPPTNRQAPTEPAPQPPTVTESRQRTDCGNRLSPTVYGKPPADQPTSAANRRKADSGPAERQPPTRRKADSGPQRQIVGVPGGSAPWASSEPATGSDGGKHDERHGNNRAR